MFYFDGDYRRVPQQILSGASVIRSRNDLLDTAKRQRQQREQNRIKETSILKIQSWTRSWLVRLKAKRERRDYFDFILKANSMNIDFETLRLLTKNLLFFYSDKWDGQRLNFISELILKYNQTILEYLIQQPNSPWLWYISWLLRLNIKLVKTLVISDSKESITVPLRLIEVFTTCEKPEGKVIMGKIFLYIIRHGHFECIRKLLEYKTPPLMVPEGGKKLLTLKAPTPLSAAIFDMISRSLILKNILNENEFCEVMDNLCFHLLTPPFINILHLWVIPTLGENKQFPFESLVECLINSTKIPKSPLLLYAYLHLDRNYLENSLSNITKIIHYLQVLASLSSNLCKLRHSRVHKDDDEDEDLVLVLDATEADLLEECLSLLNDHWRTEQMLKIIDRFNDSLVLQSICQIGHNLLMSSRKPVYNNRLLYMLALKPAFLHHLWSAILTANQTSAFGFSTPLIKILSRGLPLADEETDRVVSLLAVFCALFSILIPTLDESEFFQSEISPRSSMPFVQSEIVSISQWLKEISLGLVDLAFTDSRPVGHIHGIDTHHVVPQHQAQLWSYLFKVVVGVVRQLHGRDSQKAFCPEGHWISSQVQLNVQHPYFRPRSLRGYRPFQAFRGLSREELESQGPPLSVKEVRTTTLLNELPFLVAFEKRVMVLQTILVNDKMELQGDANFLQGPSIRFAVRRNYLYEDAFDKLSYNNEPNLRLKMRVRLVNKMGLDEAGVDGGGICREFLTELLKTAFDPNRGFFKMTQNNLLYPNPNVHLIVENFCEHYFFIGRILGKALYENLLVELPLAEFFLQKLIGRQSDVDMHHLASLDPVMYRNLIFLKNYEGDVQDLGLDFTILNEELGERRVEELKPNGASIPVTSANRIEYIHLMADYKLNRQIRTQCNFFRAGLTNVIPIEWVQMFNYRELQVLISGAEVPIDLNDLRAHTIYSSGYSEEHETIKIFWRTVQNFSDYQKRLLLKFVTSCSRPPLLGFKELDPAFCIQNAGANDRLPTASTCMNLLKLPEFRNDEIMREKLLYAIQSGAGFELS